MPGPRVSPLLAGVDRAAFVAALGSRLRHVGIPVSLAAMAAFADALEAARPASREALYWIARLTMVNRQHDLAAFDEIFEAVFGDAILPVDPHARRHSVEQRGDALEPLGPDARHAGGEMPADLPWHTLPSSVPAQAEEDDDERVLPELLPSAVARVADTPLENLDEDELALLGRWLEQAAPRWPTRRSRRMRVRPAGHRIALRETIAASRRTGWEPMKLQRYHAVRRPLTVTLLCDVSQSMQSYATAYLHLMRAFARTRRAETFAFSTSLTRLTPALSHQSAATAVTLAGGQVTDRYGGTHLATCLRELLVSRHGNAVRGGVLVIASDGWDSDDPAELVKAMTMARRRARRIVWLNPRAAAEGYQPLVGSMAAALPFCDDFLPADTLRALPAVLDAISRGASSRG